MEAALPQYIHLDSCIKSGMVTGVNTRPDSACVPTAPADVTARASQACGFHYSVGPLWCHQDAYWSRPIGSSLDGMWEIVEAWWMMLFIAACLWWRPTPKRQLRPWRPDKLTVAPQCWHGCGLWRSHPRQRPTATLAPYYILRNSM